MNRKGFSSIFIVLVLASLVFFILVVVEVSAGLSSGSVAENICLLTGESLLSEYQKGLYTRYGLLAMQGYDEKLTHMAQYYINENLDTEGADILGMRLKHCSVSSEKYPALDVEAFSSQIQDLSLICAASDIVSGTDLAKLLSEIADITDSFDLKKNQTEIRVDSLLSAQEDSENSSKEEAAGGEQAGELLKRYKDVSRNPGSVVSGVKAVEDPELQQALPSRILGAPQRRSIRLWRSFSSLSAKALLEGEYILNNCSHATDVCEDAFLDLEIEYILYGQYSDAENEKQIRSSLFWLRSALNLAHIYSDSRKRADVATLAAGAFSLIPLPLAAAVISGIWAAVEAQGDLDLLFQGDRVPFFKKQSDWRSDLSGAVSGSGAYCSSPREASESGSYEDYLRLFLLSVPRSERMVRLMDIMQLNIAGGEGLFCFRDYAYGFSLKADFKKSAHLPGSRFPSVRKRTVIQEHAY